MISAGWFPITSMEGDIHWRDMFTTAYWSEFILLILYWVLCYFLISKLSTGPLMSLYEWEKEQWEKKKRKHMNKMYKGGYDPYD